jgi:hypothetical protein
MPYTGMTMIAISIRPQRQLGRAIAVIFLGAYVGCTPSSPESSGPTAKQRPITSRPSGTVTIEFRRAEWAPVEGLTPVQWPLTDKMIYLHPQSEATEADIAKAVAGLSREEDEQVVIRFTPAGGEKMARLYESHRDKPVAILVNGQTVCAFILKNRVSEYASISGGFTREQVDRIVNAINGQ